MAQDIWIAGHPTQTRKQKKKRKKVETTLSIETNFTTTLENSKEKFSRYFKGKTHNSAPTYVPQSI